MANEGEGSVTRWIGDIKAGDAAGAQRLWDRYFVALVRLAQAQLRGSQRAAEDEEDAALSAFDSFCAAASQGKLPRLDDRDDLWRILVTITRRKALDQVARQRRQKRGGGRAGVETADDDALSFLEGLAGPEPTPEFAAMVAEECRRRLDALGDDTLRQVALLRMEGYTNEEIAERLDCGLRTLTRKLDLIRRAWLGEGDS